MSNIKDVKAENLISKAVEQLKKEIKAPSWASFVKTGVHKQRPPDNPDWWYVRAAAVLRKVYILGPVGTNKLATKFGGRRKRGVMPEVTRSGSRNIIRKVLQQLEKSGYIIQATKGAHKGRVLTPKALKLFASITKNELGRSQQKSTRTSSNATAVTNVGAPGKELPK